MPGRILAGPFLGLEGDTAYTVCFLASKDTENPQVIVDDVTYTPEQIQETPSGVFWRAAITVQVENVGRFHRYHIRSTGVAMQDPRNRLEWEFWGPGHAEEPRIAYTSCNGFSEGDAKTKLDEPYGLWTRMVEDHFREPFALLIMGGDQLYADEIWHSRRRVPSVVAWSQLSRAQRTKQPVNARLQGELNRFYEDIYIRHWNQADMALMMASVPSLMMWDDHDIFDGWGSYPDDLQNCPVYQAIFAAARRYFELFQLRSQRNTTLLRPGGEHYSFALRFRDYGILGLDLRTNRTEAVVMSDQNWLDVKSWLDKASGHVRTLLVLSAVPVIYRDFRTTEAAIDITPWQEQLTDDIRDRWRSRYHEGERMKLIMNLFAFQPRSSSEPVKRVILAGDVHVGCLGVIRDRRVADQPCLIYEVVSSGILHPPPTWYEWLGILAGSSDTPESLEHGQITTEIIEPYGSDRWLRTRNYASLKEGTDGKLWANWACESSHKPEYPIEGSA
jgi:PhoD related phosphatase